MKRLKMIFAIVIVLLALPLWRYIDMVAILSPFEWPLPLTLTMWFGLFIAIPLKLIRPQIKTPVLVLLILCFGSLSFWAGPLSKMATVEPEFNHCGPMTYTEVFYPIAGYVSDAHRDDLEARNQLCWVKKMISRVPRNFGSEHEVITYTKLIQDKLFKPEIKYRATLPLIAVLYFTINTSGGQFVSVKHIYDSLQFWVTHYTEEISNREYSAWNRPHSDYIKFECGLVEKNWQSLIDSITIEQR